MSVGHVLKNTGVTRKILINIVFRYASICNIVSRHRNEYRSFNIIILPTPRPTQVPLQNTYTMV